MKVDYVWASWWGCIAFIAGMFLMLAGTQGCIPNAESPERATARASILIIARATQTADILCAQFARDTKDAGLAKSCADAYDVARPSLMAAESGVDLWDNISKDRLACATVDGVSALDQITKLLLDRKVAVPALIVDALELAKNFKELCRA